MKEPNSAEVSNVVSLDPEERSKHFIKNILDTAQIWSLKSDKGWCILGDDRGDEFFPVWPHPVYAKALATGIWSDYKPEAIPLDRWFEGWLPGLIRDERFVLVFPTVHDNGKAAHPAQHLEEILECGAELAFEDEELESLFERLKPEEGRESTQLTYRHVEPNTNLFKGN